MKRLPVFIAALLVALLVAPHPAHAAARSTRIVFNNHTPNTLVKVGQGLSHGEWGTQPPDTIYPGTEVNWDSVSNGFATGTEGWVRYTLQRTTPPPNIPDADTFYIHWNNPFIGSNSYDTATPSPDFAFKREGGDGNNATVKFILNAFVDGLIDSDGDGIPDQWETSGVSIAPNGTGTPVFVDLPHMGADPNKPDMFMQTDWMQNSTQSEQLDPSTIKSVVDAFASAPYTSPTGSKGVNLHIDNGPNSILDFTTNTTWGALSQARAVPWVHIFGSMDSQGNYNWFDFQSVKDTNFTPTGRGPLFHYVIAANYVDDSSKLDGYAVGISRDIPASDLVLGATSLSNDERAVLLMHELGHNLGLHHGGDEDLPNYKPNYLSVMNYSFSINGLIVGGMPGGLDYSRSELPNLNEEHLNETLGIQDAPAGYGSIYRCLGDSVQTVQVASGSIDWNCTNGSNEVDVSADINNDQHQSPPLHGYDDWSHIRFNGGAVGQGNKLVPLPLVTPGEEPYDPEFVRQIREATRPQTMLSYTGGNLGQNGWLITPVVVTLNASDPLGNPIVFTEYSLDNQNWTHYNGPFTLPEGRITVFYRSQNTVGTLEDTKQHSFQIDTITPQSILTIGLPQYASGPPPVIPSATPLTVTGTDSSSGMQSIAYRFALQGSPVPEYTIEPGNSVQFKITGADGIYEVTTFAIDNAGNAESPHIQYVRLANTRVLNGLQSFYIFDENTGTTINDVAGVSDPLNLTLLNATAAQWTSGGLKLTEPAMLASAGPATQLNTAISATNELTLEAWIIPTPTEQNDLARILTLSDNHSQRNIELLEERDGSDKARYSVRLRTSDTTSSARPPLRTPAGIVAPTLQHIVFTRDALGMERIYVDGVQRAQETSTSDLSTWNMSYHLVLGNTLLNDRPWLGEYQLAAIYNRALSPAEVRQNFEAGPSGATTPVAKPALQSLYTFSEGSGATVTDQAGNETPLNLVISDTTAIQWTADGLTLNTPTVLSSLAPATRVISAAVATGEVSLEAWVTPAAITTDRAAAVLSIASNNARRNVEMLEEHDDGDQTLRYNVRLRTNTTSSSGHSPVRSHKAPMLNTPQHIVYTRDALGIVRLYVNGVKQTQRTVRGDFSNWDISYQLTLGNTLVGNRPWLGTYHRIAIHNRALSPTEVSQLFNAGR